VNPEPFLQLDRVIHEKGRLAIMSLLAASPSLSFTEIRDTLKMTDGNATAHLRTLHEAGYVAVTKSMEAGRNTTSYSLTAKGRAEFSRYLDLLAQIVQQTRS
jgi:DNA-binding MarR family transcriptional regulator